MIEFFFADIRVIYTKYEAIGCPSVKDDRIVVVLGVENEQVIVNEYNSPPVDVTRRRIDGVSGCLASAGLVDEECLVVPNRFVVPFQIQRSKDWVTLTTFTQLSGTGFFLFFMLIYLVTASSFL